MNQKALNALEYPKIIEKLTEKASSYMGKQLCKNLEPSTDLETIRLMQVQTKDALTRLFQKGSISFGNVKDIRGSLKRLEIGSALSIQEILAVCGLLENTSRVKTYSRKERNDLPGDSLDSMFDGLSPLTPLSTEIRRCILSEEEISDDASPALRQIRRNMKITNDRIHTQLAGLVNGSARTYLQDSVITMRNGRYCIPVKAEYKGQVPGMIHDQSSTGSTLFIEPMSVVKLNNDMRELELQEQKEIEVILADLSQQIATEQEAISLNLELMVQLDFIFARATLATTGMTFTPAFFHRSMNFPGFPAPVVTACTPSSTTIFATSSALGLSSMIFTPKGLSVSSLHLRISSRTTSGGAEAAPMMPKPPAFDTAAASLCSATHAMPPWKMGYSICRSSVIFVLIVFLILLVVLRYITYSDDTRVKRSKPT